LMPCNPDALVVNHVPLSARSSECTTGAWRGKLQPVAASAKEKEEDDEQQEEAEPATAVVANARPHVIAASAGQHKKNHKDEYQWHK